MDKTLRQQLRDLIYEEMRYYRHYDGIVVDNQDPITKGRVRVRIEELGQVNNDQGIWARPRQLHALDVPIPGEIVEVYFINGDRTRAVYLANSAENKGQIPAAYTDPSKHVLWQDPTTGDSIIYDHAAKTFTLLNDQIILSSGDEAFVKGTTFYSFMQSLMTWLGTHVHSGVTTGAGSSGPSVGAPSLTDFRSTKIKGS